MIGDAAPALTSSLTSNKSMVSDEERLAEAAEYGRRRAAETKLVIDECMQRTERMTRYAANCEAARRHVQATGGTGQDAMRIVFEAGETPLDPPRPKLVKVEG